MEGELHPNRTYEDFADSRNQVDTLRNLRLTDPTLPSQFVPPLTPADLVPRVCFCRLVRVSPKAASRTAAGRAIIASEVVQDAPLQFR
jgi:hypothetical protein